LPAAGIIEVISGPRRRPLLEYPPYQWPFRDLGLGEILGYISYPKAVQRGIANLKDAIEDERSVYPHFELASMPLKFPRI
jgi:hypothetical protein